MKTAIIAAAALMLAGPASSAPIDNIPSDGATKPSGEPCKGMGMQPKQGSGFTITDLTPKPPYTAYDAKQYVFQGYVGQPAKPTVTIAPGASIKGPVTIRDKAGDVVLDVPAGTTLGATP